MLIMRLTRFYVDSTFQENGVLNKEKHGEFVLEVQDGSLFAVVGYGGDKSLAYLCIQSHRAALFHSGTYVNSKTFLSMYCKYTVLKAFDLNLAV